ncbi:tyrosine-type recombinase/integrase [Shewanella salipaludis]|uniref:Tyrosine-type recombinase/integrase n=1 Tax=Shewanella salipaludis TaxID=2723052 RepID=A0A972FXX7_9GAMM|nr:site-specific integrase [Shewanella salipaludis]NMH63946.1 tyrosine-type recombinase/integrase [Shewanella salipaludis]
MSYPPVMPLFDTVDSIQLGNCHVNQYLTQVSLNKVTDAGLVMEHATDWLYEQQHNENNYKAYRSELTTFLHWCFDVAAMSPTALTRKDMGRYVDYCRQPPQALIGYFNVAQFKDDKETRDRRPNPQWRPFVGKKILGQEQEYSLSDNALKTKMAILSSFYSYLVGEEYCERNPAQIWLNHSRFSGKRQFRAPDDEDNCQAFTQLQWSYVIACVTQLAEQEPELHQRSLFLVKLIYCCYLRVSDVSARAGYAPVMSQFRQNRDTGIWSFHIPQSKGGKRRSVAISKALLDGLVEYRRFLGLSDYPAANEQQPLFVRHRAAGRGRDAGLLNANLGIRQIREEIQQLILLAAAQAEADGFVQDAIEMRKLTAHNLRHTGITHDININRRPLSHVQADAGHESIDTTSQYLHTSQIERHESAYGKPLDRLQGID